MISKKTILKIVLYSIFLIGFNVFFFVLSGSEHTASVWTAYSFIHIAYLLFVFSPLFIKKGKAASVYGYPIHVVATLYFIVELIVGVVFICVERASFILSFLVQFGLFLIYGIFLLTHLIANEKTADAVNVHDANVAYIKDASSKLALIINNAPDKQSAKYIERAYDCLHGSPTKSNNSVIYIEEEILKKIDALNSAVIAQDVSRIQSLANEIISLTNMRNAKL